MPRTHHVERPAVAKAPPRVSRAPTTTPAPHPVQQLQRDVGNQAVTELFLSQQAPEAEAGVSEVPPAPATSLTLISATRQFVRGLTNEELAQQSLEVRRRIGAVTVDSPEYEALQQNLHLLEAEAARRKVDLPAPTLGHALLHEGRTLTPDPVLIRYQLEQIIIADGELAAEEFIHSFEWEFIRSKLPEHGVSDDPVLNQEVSYSQDVLNVLRSEHETLSRENRVLLVDFENALRETVLSILIESEKRLDQERQHYGITEEIIEKTLSVAGMDFTARKTKYHLQESPATKGLAAAAEALVAHRREIEVLYVRQSTFTKEKCWKGDCAEVIMDYAAYNAVQTEINAKEEQWKLLRVELESRYPILASWAESKDERALEKLSRSTAPDMATMLGAEIAEKRENIKKVREKVKPGGDVKVWKLAEIVSITKDQMVVAPGTIRDRVINDEIQRVKDEEFWHNLAWSVLAIGLGILAALPTGGSSLAIGVGAAAAVGSLSIGAFMTWEHYKEYQAEKAMGGTDFDRARAISQDDPSLFWLGLDIALTMLDIGPALKASRAAFRELAPLARRAIRGGQTADEAAEALFALRRAAVKEGGEKLEQKVVDTAAWLREKVDPVRKAELEEFRKLAKAHPHPMIQALEPEALERVLAKAPNIDHVKGQLLEELLAPKALERAAAESAKRGAKVEFIPGHLITDAGGAQLTDGILAIREGDKLRIITVFESKAGAASSKGLRRSYTSLSELSPDDLKVLREQAIDELKELGEVPNKTIAYIEKNYPDKVLEKMKEIPQSETGQARRDIERLVANAADEGQVERMEILVNGVTTEVFASPKTTTIVGTIPSDVATARRIASLKEALGEEGQGLLFEALKIDITSADLERLAEDLVSRMGTR